MAQDHQRDLDYYCRRLAEEELREAQCALPEIRQVHRELAEMYRARVGQLEQRETA